MKKTLISSDKDDSDDFYRDLDETRSHGSCCTFQTMIILFFVILFIIVGGIIYLYFQIKNGGLFTPSKVAISLTDAQNKIKNLSAVNGEAQLTFSSDELAAVLSHGISAENFVLQDLTASISSENILFYGNLVKPMSSRVVISATSEVENGRVVFRVKQTSAGSVHLPQFLNKDIQSRLNENFTNKMSLFYAAYDAKDVKLEQNKMIISGVKK